jgi:murein DD-endopeptidase MepM/ murein hydrolase activator NlpD
MINPGQGYAVSSDFGTRKDPNGTATQHHGGIDYKMPVGTPVLAAADGIVETVTTQSGGARSYGNYIVLKHDGFFTYYAHLSKFSVKVGDVVRQGQMIGLSGGAKGAPGAGSSTGPHLHFEVRKDKSGSGQDPKSWFGKVKSSVANLFNTKSDAYKNFDWTSPSGLDSGSRAAVAGGTRLSELISQRASRGFEDISDGALGWAKTHGSSGVLDYASTLTSNNAMDAASGDAGGMAFGSRKGLMSALYRQGFRGKSLQTAFAVALAESGGKAVNPGDVDIQNSTYGPSMGVFQIRSYKDPKKWGAAGQWRDGKKLNDPTFNLQAAWNISNQGKNWDAWSAYKNGSFSKYLDDAQAAARKAGIKVGFYGDERTQEGLTYTHQDEVLMTKMEADRIRNRPTSAGGGNITVNMDVKIARAGIEEVQTLLQGFKSALQNDKFLEQIGGY